jgi:hypothetical protein
MLLTQSEQVEQLYRNGVYIGKRKVGKTAIVLYQLEGFYAEVYYQKYRCVIESVNCFACTARLDPYLAEINIGYLV